MKDTRHDDRTELGKEIIDKMPDLPGGIAILVTQAFCPNGHNLVYREDVSFSGQKGISINVAAGDWEGEVVLSPFHGDSRKIGMSEDIAVGIRCRLTCPVCGVDFPVQTKCGCQWGGDLRGLYLRADLQDSDQIMLCDVNGCQRSRFMDNLQVISEFADREDNA